MKITKLLTAVAVACLAAGLVGCSGGDVDPSAKVDAPGYYNGEMKPKGQPKGTEGAPAAGTTA